MTSLAPITTAFRTFWSNAARTHGQDQKTIEDVRRCAGCLRTESSSSLFLRVQALRDVAVQGGKPFGRDVTVQGLALVCEAVRRSLGIDYYDEQIYAGLVMTRAAIAEMATGEGKTLAAAFPAFMHALTGKGVHVMTVNAYLAQRDAQLLSPVFEQLGLSVGLIQAGAPPAEKRAAYECDITYGPGYEFGFDYLRDQLALMSSTRPRLGDSVRKLMRDSSQGSCRFMQRDRAFAVIDEADSVMLDEATTPLVISGCDEPLSRSPAAYVEACRVGRLLSEGTDFTIDRDAGRVWLTDTGLQRAAAEVDADALQSLCRPWPNYVERALVAELLLQRDCEYIVKGDKIVLVDEFTGRLFSDRTLRDGVHQAVQAKEGLPISAETQPVAHISRQRFLRLYRGLCGMTGTATGSERELRRAYGVNVTAIPTRLPCKREVYPTRYFATEAAKWNAIALEIARLHATDRPVLVGTRTIDASEKLAARLRLERLPFQLLNGRDDAVEAGIISRAGQTGTITIATNLAGRGTDIKLGQGVAQLGGLHVIGTERHESARVDRQLIGRSARQGDPGSCQFFVSAEDHLITHYGPWLGQFMKELGSGEIARDLSRKLRPVQKHAERLAYALRARLLKQDRWQQRVLDQLASEDRS